MSISALNRINTVISISKAAAHNMNSTKNEYSVTIYFYFLKTRCSAECSYCSKPNNRIIKEARKLLSCVPPKNKSHEGEKTMTESLFVTQASLENTFNLTAVGHGCHSNSWAIYTQKSAFIPWIVHEARLDMVHRHIHAACHNEYCLSIRLRLQCGFLLLLQTTLTEWQTQTAL